MEALIPYYILTVPGMGEITEKKSKFIAHVGITTSEEEAILFIEGIRKRFWDARHHCYATVIGSNNEYVHSCDDGEPSGTAGRPILEVIQRSQIKNITIVVTRYFGGVLLGTGGLVRAYTKAAKEGLNHSQIGLMKYGIRYQLQTDYNAIGKIQYLLAAQKIEIVKIEYTQDVNMELMIPFEKVQFLMEQLIEATSGKVGIKELERAYFVDKKDIV